MFNGGDEAPAVLNYDYWRRRFNGDDAVVGRTLQINGRPITIVGVAAPGFQGTGIQSCDVWLVIGPGEPRPAASSPAVGMRPEACVRHGGAEAQNRRQAIIVSAATRAIRSAR